MNMKNLKIRKTLMILGVACALVCNIAVPAKAAESPTAGWQEFQEWNDYTYHYTPAVPVLDQTTLQRLPVIETNNVNIDGLNPIPWNHYFSVQQDIEYRVLDLLNAKRVEYGFNPVQMDENATKLARYKSNDMLQYNYFAHEYTNGIYNGLYFYDMQNKLHWCYNDGGENILRCNRYCFSNDYSADNSYTPEKAANVANLIFNDWWNSDGHRENMMDPYFSYIGIGIILDKDTNSYYGTQELFSE